MGVAFWPYDVDRTFSVVPVLQLVATIVIVLLVQQIFERRYSEHRIEKDLLIGRVKEVQKLAAETSKHCHDTFLKQEINVFDEQLMLLKLRQEINAFQSFETFSSDCGFPIDETLAKRINGAYLTFKKELTAAPFPHEPYDLTVVDKQASEVLPKIRTGG